MKNWKIIIGLVLALGATVAQAAITVPGADGSDGALLITENTQIDLSLATTGAWDDAGTGNGVYDSNKWAVVFKYSSVVVTNGATLTFANHPSRAPVVWLVNGDVTILGTVNLDGQGSMPRYSNIHAEGGPGGFRGGLGDATGLSRSAGLGVGGGRTDFSYTHGAGGSYGTVGENNTAAAYGNPSLIPLIGGSGGAGSNSGDCGGAGGGAILIAATQAITLNGTIRAIGGAGISYNAEDSGSGSGGGIRLVSDSLSGTGSIIAYGNTAYWDGGEGRIRVERVTNDGNFSISPDPSVLGLESGATALLWPPAGAPEVRIVSVGGVSIPGDPRASFGAYGADAALPQTNSTQIVVETTNVESASQVLVRLTPRHSGTYAQYAATLSATNNLDPLVLRWIAQPTVKIGYSAVQVRVVRP
ncbi:hypothetical protein PDESU_02854 [Pontiella desulfatans]|uniref:Uncharacterized protein n=1 Tax=Pontiella desulfatans TaxID=2750659 RepID=A0A6C2U355_PONDE|nr:hypothetical protein [Pontiella desulfatans]VGO14295.1 hypothetical protein PDESU_02854 [Pontiella desulfatans]